LFDPATEKVAQRTYVGTYLRGFEYADKALWVGSRGGLLKYPVKPAASIPASDWTPIRLSPEEHNKALASMRITERATLLLMDGDRLKAREALAPKTAGAVTNTQAIHLLLTALSFDPRHGEAKQRREFLEKVSSVEGTVGHFANTELQQIAAADTNGDGDISAEELVARAKPPTNSTRFPGARRFTNTFRPMISTNRP
jgi:hypothetical protein